MKKHWYLVASLPYLRFGEKPALTADGFRHACKGWLSDAESAEIDALLENREPLNADDAWWNLEVQLRDAIVRVRAKQRGADSSRFIKSHSGFSATLEKHVADAFTRANPLEQEMELDRIRWSLADERELTDSFGFAAVAAFAVKVRIAERWAGLDEEAGKLRTEEMIDAATSLENEQETTS
jgi:hypothetical protein